MPSSLNVTSRRSYNLAALSLCLVLTACSTLSGEQRAGASTLGCVNAVIEQKVPAGLNDKLTHCIAGGMIARHCSAGEAYLAGAAKELKDLVTPGGDAEWADLRADGAGVRCSRGSADDAGLRDCCEQAISR